MVGGFAAMEAMRVLIGFGDSPTSKLHIINGLAPSWRTMRLPKDPGCSGCGS
jgi:adenylyltransferase/sulfurtransferase